MNLRAAIGFVAVNALFIFMAKHNLRALRRIDQRVQTLKRRVPKRIFFHARIRIKAEQANIFGIHRLGNLQRMQKALAMRGKIIGNVNLSDRRSDRPHDQPRVLQPIANLLRLRNRQIGNVRSLHIANFQTVQTVAAHRGDLTRDERTRFIGKSIHAHLFILPKMHFLKIIISPRRMVFNRNSKFS